MPRRQFFKNKTGLGKNYRKHLNHPASEEAKAKIRRNVLDVVGASAHVFDAFAGTGEMYRRVWHAAAGYVGCDKNWTRGEGRAVFVADNVRVMRAIDLSRFAIFDLDAFGSPWEQAIIVAARRRIAPGERLGLILTDGGLNTLKMGGQPIAFAELTGMRVRTEGMGRAQGFMIDRAIAELGRRMKAKVIKRWDARGNSLGWVRYVGLVFEGDAAAPA